MSNRLSRATSVTHPLEWMDAAALFTPQGYEPGYDYPLVVWLPDRSRPFDLGRAMRRLSLRNYLAVVPHRTGDDAVWEAIERVSDRASVHPRRVYLVGQGAGGSAAFRLACRHPTAFGGVVSLGGEFPLDEGLFARIAEVRRLPMLLCQSGPHAADAARRTDRMLRVFHAAGAMLAMRIYRGGDDLSKAILADVNRWLMDEICGTSSPVPSAAAS